jgi:2-C-methyl-D-erythritol 4-phosphate cytidylyltransferase/2-C-methyl-D-erythritol 2,4-cyclodiphosphate synthase
VSVERIGAVLVAAGASERAGPGVPKQFRTLGVRPMLVVALAPLLEVCDEVAVVVPESDVERTTEMLRGAGIPAGETSGGAVRVVAGGARRQDSVGNGLAALSREVDLVLVHDAARPFASAALARLVAEAASEHGAAVPVVPVHDTVKRVEDDEVVASLDRSVLRLSQTPQGFRRDVLEAAREATGDADVTDDAQCVEMAGRRVAVVDGEWGNVKITTPEDLALADLRAADAAGLGPDSRVGTGSDWHRLVPGRRLVLAGVEVPFDLGLDGWSDADVATHAVMDALLGAAGERDIGHHFPPGESEYEGASSMTLLERVVAILDAGGFAPASVDVTIVAEAPRLSPHIDRMREIMAAALGLPPARVSVKATTTEGCGPEGRGEVISAAAVAVVTPRGNV